MFNRGVSRSVFFRIRASKTSNRKYNRSFASTSTTAAQKVSPSSTAVPALSIFTDQLDKISPRFDIDGSQVKIICTPADFYATLKDKIRNAKTRVFLSTLYVGRTEHELVDVIREALRNSPDLVVSILTDALRGTRELPESSCANLLAPLVSEFGASRVDVRMYHTPNLVGWKKRYLPKRINEGWGLQHMKLYGVDDEIFISGANLSNDYFTNRQDRYHLFSSKEMTDYFWRIHGAIGTLSYLVVPDKSVAGCSLKWPKTNRAPDPIEHPHEYITSATSRLGPLIQTAPGTSRQPTNTSVYPLSQFTQLLRPDTSTELPAITTVLQTLAAPKFQGSSWVFTAGYFNPDPSLTKLLLKTQSERCTVVTASPWANGFYGSKGVSGLLPGAYTLLSRRFLETVHRVGRSDSISLREWRKGTVGESGAWTYHAKGLWVTLPGESRPSITLVGSSNYTKRSYRLDLEMCTLVVTSDERLKARLLEEQGWLQESTKRVTLDDFTTVERRVGLRVRVAMWLVSLLGAAL